MMDGGDIMYRATRYTGVYWRRDQLYYRVRDESGRWVERRYGTGSPKDAAKAQMIAQERIDAIRAGVLDMAVEDRDREARRPIEEQKREYLDYLETKKTTAKHRAWVSAYLRRLIDESAAVMMLDLTAIRVMRWLEQFDGARSRNAAGGVVRAWLSWAVDTGRLPLNPIPRRLMAKANEQADRRTIKRALTVEELDRLLTCSDIPPYRRLAYRILARTGLRWTELRRLEWSDIDLEAGWITFDASKSKTKREATMPITDDLAQALRETKQNGTKVVRVPRKETWRKDIESAKIEPDINGRLACRSCLRLTYGTHLALAGVDLRTTQKLMRHSDPKLTANVYTDPVLLDLRAAAGKLASTNCPQTTETLGDNQSTEGTKKKATG
jgi:integrase